MRILLEHQSNAAVVTDEATPDPGSDSVRPEQAGGNGRSIEHIGRPDAFESVR